MLMAIMAASWVAGGILGAHAKCPLAIGRITSRVLAPRQASCPSLRHDVHGSPLPDAVRPWWCSSTCSALRWTWFLGGGALYIASEVLRVVGAVSVRWVVGGGFGGK